VRVLSYGHSGDPMAGEETLTWRVDEWWKDLNRLCLVLKFWKGFASVMSASRARPAPHRLETSVQITCTVIWSKLASDYFHTKSNQLKEQLQHADVGRFHG